MNFTQMEYLNEFANENEIHVDFCTKLEEYLNSNFAIPVANGTLALEVALKALELSRGKSVIVPDISFFATATAVANCGLIPVYGDIDETHFGITLQEIKRKHSPEVAAVIVVHFAGVVNREIFQIRQYCKEHNLKLIVDCAQAFACRAKEMSVGQIGDIATFSFQSSKLLNSGEGGLVVTQSQDIANNCKSIVNWGQIRNGFLERNLNLPCGNYRMSSILCFFLLKQLHVIDEIIDERLQKISDLQKEFDEYQIEIKLPESKNDFFDCLFFLPVVSNLNLHSIEPRSEHPLRKSKLVHSILKILFPDLIEQYEFLNQPNDSIWNSDKTLQTIDFINIQQIKNISPKEVARWYSVKSKENIS